MKIDIIYRCCGKETGGLPIPALRPTWFSKEKCFKSVLNMRDQIPNVFSLHVQYDGADSTMLDYIKQKQPASIYWTNENSPASIDHQWILADRTGGDFIYFVEDDYLHTPDAAKVLCEGAERLSLITLYDHNDRYTRLDDLTKNQESVEVTKSCHWRTAESTTCTWGCSRALWGRIKKTAIHHRNEDRVFFRTLLKMGVRLWTPMPGQSTHCVTPYMTPLVDWEKVSSGVVL